MTDRELLEFAAKAAGVVGEYELGVIWHKNPFGDDVGFNPLTDDGDALRLAVSLKFGVTVDEPDTSVTSQYGKVVYQQSGPDPYAATRRAIVRAAAEIGKAMP